MAPRRGGHLSGVIGGGQIGYNWQTGNLLFGVEADFQGSGERGATRERVRCGLHGVRQRAYALVRHGPWPRRLCGRPLAVLRNRRRRLAEHVASDVSRHSRAWAAALLGVATRPPASAGRSAAASRPRCGPTGPAASSISISTLATSPTARRSPGARWFPRWLTSRHRGEEQHRPRQAQLPLLIRFDPNGLPRCKGRPRAGPSLFFPAANRSAG